MSVAWFIVLVVEYSMYRKMQLKAYECFYKSSVLLLGEDLALMCVNV